MKVNMQVVNIILIAFLAVYQVEMGSVPKTSGRHKRGLTNSKCEQEYYFDPNLGESGRCQPCAEICNPTHYISENLCEQNMDQCSGTYTSFHSTISPIPVKLTDEAPSEQKTSSLIIIIATVTVVLAIVMTALLTAYLYKNRQRFCRNCCAGHPRTTKAVLMTSLHQSKEQMCVSGISRDALDHASQAVHLIQAV